MNNNVQVKETANPPLNIVLWVVSVAIVIAAVYGNSYFGGESLLYRVLGLLAASVVAALIAFQTVQGKAFWLLLKGARTEIRKVVWPNRQETVQTTLIVVAVVLVMALLLWGLDSLLSWAVSSLIG